MLNKRAIFEALNATPLCNGQIIRPRAGMVDKAEYCAMGALAKAVGASDEYLKKTLATGSEIWNDFGHIITAKFGIESLQQFQGLMHVNDAQSFELRNKRVMKHVDALTPEEVDEIIQDVPQEQSIEAPTYFGPDD